MNPSGAGGLGCSSGLVEDPTKPHGFRKFEFFKPQALMNMATSNITAVSVENKLKQRPQ